MIGHSLGRMRGTKAPYPHGVVGRAGYKHGGFDGAACTAQHSKHTERLRLKEYLNTGCPSTTPTIGRQEKHTVRKREEEARHAVRVPPELRELWLVIRIRWRAGLRAHQGVTRSIYLTHTGIQIYGA